MAQHTKLQFCIGDVFTGTAWPCIKAKHEIADYYRAGGFKALSRKVKKLSRTITAHHFSGCGTAEISFSAGVALDGRPFR